jgi:hypothetical protein
LGIRRGLLESAHCWTGQDGLLHPTQGRLPQIEQEKQCWTSLSNRWKAEATAILGLTGLDQGNVLFRTVTTPSPQLGRVDETFSPSKSSYTSALNKSMLYLVEQAACVWDRWDSNDRLPSGALRQLCFWPVPIRTKSWG